MGHALLCEPYIPTSKIVIPDMVRSSGREMRATVLAVGPDAWQGDTYMSKRAEPGDKVLISKYAGVMVTSPVDGKVYRLCNDEDVFCKITAESWEEVGVKDPVVKEQTRKLA